MIAYRFSPFSGPLAVDRLFNAAGVDTDAPAYDVLQTGEQTYRISVLAPGFNESDLKVEAHGDRLTVEAAAPAIDEGQTWLHRGIARPGLKRVFRLAEHVNVSGASLENGVLQIDLAREVPEALKPRKITVNTATEAEKPALASLEAA